MTNKLSDPARLCILSGRFPRSEFLHSWNHYAYARTHGYTYIGCDWPTAATNRYMTKFMYVRHYLNLFDYVFWIDDDAFFLQPQKGLDDFIPASDKLASFCRSPTNKEIFTYLSSGQFLIRGGAESTAFIDAITSTDLDTVEAWWREDMGMFTKGDQDAIVFLLHTDPRFQDRLSLHDYSAFNSRIADLEDTPENVFLLHFTGPRPRKIADAARAAELLGTGPALISPEVEKELLGGRSRTAVLEAMAQAPERPRNKKSGLMQRLSHLNRRLRGRSMSR